MDWFKTIKEKLDVRADHRDPPSPVAIPDPESLRGGSESLHDTDGADSTGIDIVHPGPEGERPWVEPPLPDIIDPLDIPPFLRRRPGGWVYPSLHGASPCAALSVSDPMRTGHAVTGATVTTDGGRHYETMTNDQLALAIGATVSLVDRQPYYRELRRREDRAKAYARLQRAGLTGPHSRATTEPSST